MYESTHPLTGPDRQTRLRRELRQYQANMALAVYASKWAFWSLIFVHSDAHYERQRGLTTKLPL